MLQKTIYILYLFCSFLLLTSCDKSTNKTIYKLNNPILHHYTLKLSANHAFGKTGFAYKEIILITDTATFFNNIDKHSAGLKDFKLDFDSYSYIYLNAIIRQKGLRNVSVLNCTLIDNGGDYELKLMVDTKRTTNKSCIELFNLLKCNRLEFKPMKLNIVYDYQILNR